MNRVGKLVKENYLMFIDFLYKSSFKSRLNLSMNLFRFRLIVDPLPSESEATWNPRITHENEGLFVVIVSLKYH